MKSSELVTVTPKHKGVVIGEMTEHREIIKKYAEKGYCFVTVIPTATHENSIWLLKNK